jgi:hypothetical protein
MSGFKNSSIGRESNRRARLAPLVLGGIALAIGCAVAPARMWANLMLTTFLLVGMGLGGLLFLALADVTGARWSNSIRPLAAALGRTLPWTAALLFVVLLAGLGNYPWMHEDLAAHRPTFWFKAAWLEPRFFVVRTVLYLAIWVALAAALVGGRQRRAQDAMGEHGRSRRSAGFLVLFAFTFWLATTDWIMSLEPEWYSTIFAVYHFSGVLVGSLAAITLLAIWRSPAGSQSVTRDQLHDLGKLLFGFSSFWMYLWFSQYMLIWYTNIPEETFYYVRRTQGTWQPLFVLNFALNWAIPFFVLLPRAAKRSPSVLLKVSIILLAGRWLDLYLAFAPPLAETPAFGFSEVGALLVALTAAGMLLRRAIPHAPPMDPGNASAALPGAAPEAEWPMPSHTPALIADPS